VFVIALQHYREVARVLENAAKWSLGVLMYAEKAELFHLPIFLIVESSMPAWAADVAAPILKLWPAKLSCGRPRAWRACLILKVNTDLVRGCPFLKRKNGPGPVPLAAMYWRLAVTGHKEHAVFPIYTSTPFPSWSVFDFLRWILDFLYSLLPRPPMQGVLSCQSKLL